MAIQTTILHENLHNDKTIRKLRPCTHKECFGYKIIHKNLGVPLCQVCKTLKNGR